MLACDVAPCGEKCEARRGALLHTRAAVWPANVRDGEVSVTLCRYGTIATNYPQSPLLLLRQQNHNPEGKEDKSSIPNHPQGLSLK